ncbi:hypothetical protein DUI87_26226 [Hirundo rustica rustica]|uniref:Uncharacterized protein n=1 Tax=Hirundo rustica rustica TaxID=333673 RepID=A0A3M0J810_HIRRU|nr:hypothetical protein DUI87_26226 [Hirundo rustica rustica]
MLPADWPVLIVDLKDCFFTIPLHPDDRPKFGFTVPTINNAEPAQRYQWRVLPQGMRNSPMLCQWYVARALSGVRKRFPDAHVYHYMDDILVATPTQEELLRLQPQLLNALHSHGLQVAPEKVQQQPPWKYLGVKILERTIRHQEVQFVQSVKTLNDAQKLVGVITWLRPYLGLTTARLSPLFELLKGDTDLKSPRELTPEARKVLEEVQQAVSACQVYRIEPSIDVTVFITTPDLHPTGIIGQWNDDWTDPLHVLEWVFLPHQPHKTATVLFELIARLIIKCRQRCLQLMGADPSKIILPVQREEFDWSYANNVSLQSALEGFSGQITYHLPSHKLLQVAKNTQFSLRPKSSQEPVQGPTVFTDGSGKTGKAIVTWQDGSEWQVLEGHEDGSAQLVELKAAVMAFEKFSQEPFNLITDSAYVADIAQRLSCSVLKEVSNPALFDLLKALWCAIQARVHPYYVLHVRSHTNLPGFVAEGNARADKLANPAWVAPQPDVLAQAKASHGFFHQNAHTLQKQFQLTATEAREIVESCDDCHVLGAPLPAGVNPRGLKALELWQTDVTQVAEFGRLKYVHVTVDTFSSAMWASAHTGEKARDVIAHWRQAFAVLGIPSAVKTDNGPAYASQQASDGEQQPRAKVRVRNLVTKQWEGPYDLIAMGRGYACVSTDTGTRWLPSKCVRPDLRPQRQNSADRQDDLLIAGEAEDKVQAESIRLLNFLSAKGLKVSKAKLQFVEEEVKYLGHYLRKGEKKIDPERVKGILSIPPPKSKKQIRQLLGLMGYCRQWIENYSTKVKFLYEKLSQGGLVKWDEKDDKHLKALRHDLVNAPVLSLPDLKRPFYLFVNTDSGTAYGVLTQEWAGKKKPVRYLSKLLDPVSRGWPTCLQALVACALLVEEANKITFNGELRVLSPQNIRGILQQKAEKWITDARLLKYEGILLDSPKLTLEVTALQNPAQFLYGRPSEDGLAHECLSTIEEQTKIRPDLDEEELEEGDRLFVDGSSRVINGKRVSGYAIVGGEGLAVIESGPLSGSWSAQACELYAVLRALQ